MSPPRFEFKLLCAVFICFFVVNVSNQQSVITVRFDDFFKSCRKNDPKFDNCIKDGVNAVRPFFKTGLPQYGVLPFDPFFAKEVTSARGTPMINYKLKLSNVYESGWTLSQVTRFRSDGNKNQVQYTQFFPDKRLQGEYDMKVNILGTRISNKGTFNLTLFDYIQTTTITRKPIRGADGSLEANPPLKVWIEAQSVKKLELHISNLFGGRQIIERIMDFFINSPFQQPGFALTKPIINELVSSAFTKIFNDAFRYFPFDEIIH